MVIVVFLLRQTMTVIGFAQARPGDLACTESIFYPKLVVVMMLKIFSFQYHKIVKLFSFICYCEPKWIKGLITSFRLDLWSAPNR